MQTIMSDRQREMAAALTALVRAETTLRERLLPRVEEALRDDATTTLPELQAVAQTLGGVVDFFKGVRELGFSSWIKPDNFDVADLKDKTEDEVREWCHAAYGMLALLASFYFMAIQGHKAQGRSLKNAAGAALPLPLGLLEEAHWLLSGKTLAPVSHPVAHVNSFVDRTGRSYVFEFDTRGMPQLRTDAAGSAHRPLQPETALFVQAAWLSHSYAQARATGTIGQARSILDDMADTVNAVRDYGGAGSIALGDLPPVIQERFRRLKEVVDWVNAIPNEDAGAVDRGHLGGDAAVVEGAA